MRRIAERSFRAGANTAEETSIDGLDAPAERQMGAPAAAAGKRIDDTPRGTRARLRHPTAPAMLLKCLGVAAAILVFARMIVGSGPVAVVSWLALILIVSSFAWRADLLAPPRRIRWFRGWTEVTALVLLLAACAMLRFGRLGDFPPLVHGDSAECGNVGVALLDGGEGDVFDFSHWYLTPYLSYVPYALSFALGGVSVTTLRIPSAMAGTLALLPLYFLARTWFGVRLAFVTAALYVTSHAAIHFGRIGLWNIQILFYAVTAFALLVIGFRRRSMAWIAASGVVSGLALYSYTAGRLIPIVAAGFLLKHIAGSRRRRALRSLVFCGAGLAVAVAPLLLSYAKRPEVLAQDRSASVWVLSETNASHVKLTLGTTSSKEVLWEQTRRTLEGFFSRGDTSGQYGTTQPLLSWWAASLALVGVLAALRRWRVDRYFFALTWLGVGLLLGSVIVLDPPSHTRLIAVLPIVFVFVALGLGTVLRRLHELVPAGTAGRAVPALLCLFTVVHSGSYDVQGYREFLRLMTLQPTEWDVLKVMEKLGGSYHYYLFTGPYLFGDSPAIRLFSHHARVVSGFSESDLPDSLTHDAAFLVAPAFRHIGLAISDRFPALEREVVEQEGVPQMVVYRCTNENGCRRG